MPDVFYSIRPAGAGSGNDLKVACNITISSGTATLTAAQTGDIGVGCVIDYDSDNKIAYISEMTDSTHCKVITTTGGTPGNVSAVTVNYIYHPYASLSAAEAGSDDANHLTDDDLVTLETSLYWPCYGATADTAEVDIVATWITSSSYKITIYTPQGGTESINNWRHAGSWSSSKYYRNWANSESIRINTTYVDVCGIQFYHDDSDTGNYHGLYHRTSGSTSVVNVDACIFYSDYSNFASAIRIGYTSTCYCTATIQNTLIYGPWNYGVYGSYGTQCYLYNVTISGCADGIHQVSCPVTATNSIIFNNTDDIDGTVTATYCAGDDADFGSGTGNIRWTEGATDWAANFTDYSSGDFSVKDTDADIYHAGTDLDLTYDIAGTAWHATTPSIGAFEYPEEGGESITITAASIACSGKVVVSNAKTFQVISKASLAYTPYSIGANIRSVAQITRAFLSCTGQSLGVNAKTFIQITKASLTYTGKAVSAFIAGITTIAKAVLMYIPHLVYLNESYCVSKAMLTYIGRAVTSRNIILCTIKRGLARLGFSTNFK